jgi:hypothetical protein
MSRPAGVARLPLIETARGQGTTEMATGADAGTGKTSAPFFSGALSPTALVGAIATGAMEPSASSR